MKRWQENKEGHAGKCGLQSLEHPRQKQNTIRIKTGVWKFCISCKNWKIINTFLSIIH